jgi:hypothetical protein
VPYLSTFTTGWLRPPSLPSAAAVKNRDDLRFSRDRTVGHEGRLNDRRQLAGRRPVFYPYWQAGLTGGTRASDRARIEARAGGTDGASQTYEVLDGAAALTFAQQWMQTDEDWRELMVRVSASV